MNRQMGGESGEPSNVDTGELNLDLIERALQKEDGEEDKVVRNRLIPYAEQLGIKNPFGYKKADKLIASMRQMINFRRTPNGMPDDVHGDVVSSDPADEPDGPLEAGKTFQSEIVGDLEELRKEKRELPQRDRLPKGNGIGQLWGQVDSKRSTPEQKIISCNQLLEFYRGKLEQYEQANNRKSEADTRKTLTSLAEKKAAIEGEISGNIQPAEIRRTEPAVEAPKTTEDLITEREKKMDKILIEVRGKVRQAFRESLIADGNTEGEAQQYIETQIAQKAILKKAQQVFENVLGKLNKEKK